MQWDLSQQIIYQDEELLVLNKPPGLRTLPDGYHPALPHVRSVREPIYGRLWIVHRLALHAYQLSFAHPSSGEIQLYQGEYASDFVQALVFLRELVQ